MIKTVPFLKTRKVVLVSNTDYRECRQFSVSSLLLSVLQELQRADAPVGREPAGLRRYLQGEAAQEEGAQAEDRPSGRGGHRAGAAEQGADGAVAQGNIGLAFDIDQRCSTPQANY